MRAGRWSTLLLVALFTAVETLVAVATRHLWLGHGPRTGTMLVTAVTWPGLIMGALGAHAVVASQLKGLDAWHRTGVRSEAQLLVAPVRRLTVAALASSGVVTVVACVASWLTPGYGHPRLGHLLQANLWSVACLWVSVALAWILPRQFRWVGMLIAPVLAFWTLMVCRSMSSGPWLALGPDDSGAGLIAVESTWTVSLRLALWVSLLLVCVGVVWRHRLLSVGAGGLSVVVTLAALTLPQNYTPLRGAENIMCNATGQVCWRSWGRAGSETFAATVQPLLERTPRNIRPVKVLGDVPSDDTPSNMMAMGYPAGDDLTAVVPSASQVRRAYAEALVRQGCPTSPTDQIFLVPMLKALGIASDEGVRAWGLTEDQLRHIQPAADTQLLDRLLELPAQQYFDLLRDRQKDSALCTAGSSQWAGMALAVALLTAWVVVPPSIRR